MAQQEVITESIENRSNIVAPELSGYSAIQGPFSPLMFSGTFCCSYPLEKNGARRMCLRLWFDDGDLGKNFAHVQRVSDFFDKSSLRYVVPYKYLQRALRLNNGKVIPGVMMQWVEGLTLGNYVQENLSHPDRLRTLASKFLEMSRYMYSNGLAHGDLSSDNIIVKPDGGLCLVDYDTFYCDRWGSSIPAFTPGWAAFQHPGRSSAMRFLSKDIDNFSQQVIYLSLLALAAKPSLYPRRDKAILFNESDYRSPSSSALFSQVASVADSEVRRLLAELKSSLSGSVGNVKPLASLFANAGVSSSLPSMARYCHACGYRLGNNDYKYCPICGTSRIAN